MKFCGLQLLWSKPRTMLLPRQSWMQRPHGGLNLPFRSRRMRPWVPVSKASLMGEQCELVRIRWSVDRTSPKLGLRVLRRAAWRSALSVFVAVEGQLIGVILLADELRRDTPRAVQSL